MLPPDDAALLRSEVVAVRAVRKAAEGAKAGCPVSKVLNAEITLDASLAWLECRTIGVHDGGTHTILVGEVTWAGVQEGDDDPLLYYRSHYGTIVRSPESEKTFYESG